MELHRRGYHETADEKKDDRVGERNSFIAVEDRSQRAKPRRESWRRQ